MNTVHSRHDIAAQFAVAETLLTPSRSQVPPSDNLLFHSTHQRDTFKKVAHTLGTQHLACCHWLDWNANLLLQTSVQSRCHLPGPPEEVQNAVHKPFTVLV